MFLTCYNSFMAHVRNLVNSNISSNRVKINISSGYQGHKIQHPDLSGYFIKLSARAKRSLARSTITLVVLLNPESSLFHSLEPVWPSLKFVTQYVVARLPPKECQTISLSKAICGRKVIPNLMASL